MAKFDYFIVFYCFYLFLWTVILKYDKSKKEIKISKILEFATFLQSEIEEIKEEKKLSLNCLKLIESWFRRFNRITNTIHAIRYVNSKLLKLLIGWRIFDFSNRTTIKIIESEIKYFLFDANLVTLYIYILDINSIFIYDSAHIRHSF